MVGLWKKSGGEPMRRVEAEGRRARWGKAAWLALRQRAKRRRRRERGAQRTESEGAVGMRRSARRRPAVVDAEALRDDRVFGGLGDGSADLEGDEKRDERLDDQRHQRKPHADPTQERLVPSHRYAHAATITAGAPLHRLRC